MRLMISSQYIYVWHTLYLYLILFTVMFLNYVNVIIAYFFNASHWRAPFLT